MEPPVTGADRDGRREGRGRLSSIEMLPEECDEDIAWANAALREKKMPQTEILREFNARLADRRIKGISKGAFSRYSIRRSIEVRKMEASRQIMDVALDRVAITYRADGAIDAISLQKLVLMELLMSDRLEHRKISTAARLLVSLLKEAE